MKALTYRPNSRWRTISAFSAAAAIHLSAVAFASLHREQAIGPSTPFTGIDFEPTIGVAPTAPPQQAELPPPSPELPPSRAFVDVRTPVAHSITRQLSPIRSSRLQTLDTGRAGMGRALALSAPRPEYPYEARRDHVTGSGAVMLTVDPVTGLVVDATMTESTGSSTLDNSALRAFRRWRFKRGTPQKVRIPFTFALTGVEF
jgi:TonB family protein